MYHNFSFLDVDLETNGWCRPDIMFRACCMDWAVCQDRAVICILKFTDLAGLCLCMGLQPSDVK